MIPRQLSAFLIGLLFGLGLIVSGMADPAKVQNFLDLFGTFDPSLAFVMAGAIVVTFLGYRWIATQGRPWLGDRFQMPGQTMVDGRLVAGAALFGTGWGLTGFCPGPALVALPLASAGILMFFPAMLLGLWLGRVGPGWIAGRGSLSASRGSR